MFQQSTEICLRCLALLVDSPKGKPLQSREIGAKLAISATYVTKLLQPMARCGWLQASKGRTGGWVLKVDPKDITLREVIEALEPDRQWQRCVIGHRTCQDDSACAFHHTWGKMRSEMEWDMQNTSLEKLKNYQPPRAEVQPE